MGNDELQLKILTRENLATNVVGLTMARPDGQALPAWQAGAHIDLVLANGMTRQYSLCGDPGDLSCYRIGVLREQSGRGGSQYVHDVLNPGDMIRIRGPRNHFALLESPNYIFIPGGIGITPLLPMMARAEAVGARWQCHYGGRSRATMAFQNDLSAYGDKVRIHPQDENGLLDLSVILGSPTTDTLVYCCGPEPLLDAVAAHCQRHGWPADALHVEHFSGPAAVTTDKDFPIEVVLARSGLSVSVPANCSILQALSEAGVSVPSSCESGVCGTCETVVLEGQPDHRDLVLTDEEKREGKFMMICVSRSVLPRLVLDL